MSILLTSDVFCDTCREWTDGVTGLKPRPKDARAAAKRKGWKITRAGDFCPKCAQSNRTKQDVQS